MNARIETVRQRVQRWHENPEAAVREVFARIDAPVVGPSAQDPTHAFVRQVMSDALELLEAVDRLQTERADLAQLSHRYRSEAERLQSAIANMGGGVNSR